MPTSLYIERRLVVLEKTKPSYTLINAILINNLLK